MALTGKHNIEEKFITNSFDLLISALCYSVGLGKKM
jgi:hypothetical protein